MYSLVHQKKKIITTHGQARDEHLSTSDGIDYRDCNSATSSFHV